MGYSTIKEKIQKVDVNWTVRSQDSGDWAQLKETWKETAQVKKWAAKANEGSEDAELTDESLKKLCGEQNINSNLSDEDSYREKYLVIKSVCRGGNIDQS